MLAPWVERHLNEVLLIYKYLACAKSMNKSLWKEGSGQSDTKDMIERSFKFICISCFFFLFYTHIAALHMSLAFWAWRRQGRQKRHLAGEKKTGFSDINPINELMRTCQWDAERAEHWTDKSACFQREFLLMSEGMGERRVTSAAIPSFTSRRHPYW